MRWIKILLLTLLMLLFIVIASIGAVIKVPAVSSWSLSHLLHQLPQIKLDQLSGNLWDELAFSGLVIEHEGHSLVIEDAHIKWHWQRLWQAHELSVAQIQLGHVALDLPASTYTKPVGNTDWRNLVIPDVMVPLMVQLGQLTVRQLSVYLPNSELISLSDLAAKMAIEHNQLTIKHLSAQIQDPVPVGLSLSGQLQLITPHGFNFGVEASVFELPWADAQLSLMLAGDAEDLIIQLEALGDAAYVGPVLVSGDFWLNRAGACSPALTLVSQYGQVSGYDVRADWQQALRLSGIVRVDAYQNGVQVRGQFLPEPNLSLEASATNLSYFNRLLPISGNFQAKGKLFGSWQMPQGELALNAKQLAWQQHRIASVTLTAQGDETNLKAQLLASGFSDAGKDSRIDAKFQGSLAQHQLNLSARGFGSSLSSRLRGKANHNAATWTGQLDQLQLIQADIGLWQQQGVANVEASTTATQLRSNLCLAQQNTRVCVKEARWSDQQGVQLKAQAEDVYLKRFSPWLPPTLSLSGKAQASLSYHQKANQRQAQLEVHFPASRIRYLTENGSTELDYTNLTMNAQLNNQQLNTVLTGNFKQGINLRLQSEHRLDVLERLDLQAQISMSQLSFLQPLLSDVSGLKGSLTADISLAGTLNKPQLNANLQLAHLSFFPVISGVEFELPELLVDIKPTGLLNVDGRLLAGTGQASLKGWGSVANLSRWSLDLLIRGNDLLVAKTPQADIWLTPNIQLSATPDQVDVLGQLIVPKARLRTEAIGTKAVTLSDDVVLVGDTASASKLIIIPHMRVLLGDDIQLAGSGLKTGLTGQLEITRSRLGNLLFQGEVNTKQGQFKAYQQELTIEQGSLLFNGVSDNPGLNILASRKIQDETVGVSVTGSLAKPRLKVFSRPTIPDTDALSMLVLGKKAKDMTATDAALLASKLATDPNDDPLLQRLGQEAGLDVGLTNLKGEKNTGLALGKRLTPDLYVRYVVGAFEYGARFITEYRINRLFSVEVQTGQVSGGDIFYRFEGD